MKANNIDEFIKSWLKKKDIIDGQVVEFRLSFT